MYLFVGGQEKPNGISSYINNIGRQLVLQGHSVTVIQFGMSDKNFIQDGMVMLQRKAPRNTMLAIPYIFLCSIPFIVKKRKEIEIVNFQTTFLAFFAGWICRFYGVKVCYTQHSFGDHNPKHGRISRYVMKCISNISVFCCGRNYITISKSKAAEFKERNGRDCHIIPCGVNRPMPFANTDILKRNDIIPNRYFLIICRIDPIKNLDILIKAFLSHDNKGYQLVIGGDFNNAYGYSLNKLVGNNQDVKFVGPVSGNDKETLLRNCYANCLVSSSEGMPISLMEGMAYAKPCIVSNIPAIREIVTEDQGCWCNVKDETSLSMQFIYAENNTDELKKKGLAMQSSVFSQYTWDTIALNYVELCKRLK